MTPATPDRARPVGEVVYRAKAVARADQSFVARFKSKEKLFMQSICEVVYIKTTPEAVWSALTNPDLTERYWGGMRIESDWKPGSKVRYHRSGQVTDEHVILEMERLRCLVHTFRPLVPEFADESPSRVAFRLTARGPVVRLSVRHGYFPPHSKVYQACRTGWPIILNGMKALLEGCANLQELGAQA